MPSFYFLLVATVAVLSSTNAHCEDDKSAHIEKTKQVLENTKALGTKDLPVTNKSQNSIGVMSDQLINEMKAGTYNPIVTNSNSEMSLDCKTWFSQGAFERKYPRFSKTRSYNENLYLRDTAGAIGAISEANRTILVMSAENQSYSRVTNNAIYLVMNSTKARVFDYRPIDSKKIGPGYTGILQALVVVGSEIINDWNIFFIQKSEPRAFKSVDKKDELLNKYIALLCSPETKCRLIARNSQASVVLSADSKEASLLNQLGYFKSKKIDGYSQFCKESDVKEFKRLFLEDMSRVKAKCPKDKVLMADDFANFSAACENWTTRLYPVIKSYQR